SVPDDFFGGAVALSRDGKVALVGAPGNFLSLARPGAAFVFKLTDGGWTQQAMLTGADDPGDFFGFSVALDHGGHKALVGAPNEIGDEGAAYVFAQQDGNWPQQARLADPGKPVAIPGDNFGFSVAMPGNGQVALVGADQGGTAGATTAAGTGFAEIYSQGGGVWTPTQQLTAGDGLLGDAFG